MVNGRELQVSASIGVTFYPQADEVDADQLLRQSDQAMYQAKVAGRTVTMCSMPTGTATCAVTMSLERIRRALTAGEVRVLHLPAPGEHAHRRVIGAEALIRWQHPEKGLLPPSVFLPVIETTRLPSISANG